MTFWAVGMAVVVENLRLEGVERKQPKSRVERESPKWRRRRAEVKLMRAHSALGCLILGKLNTQGNTVALSD